MAAPRITPGAVAACTGAATPWGRLCVDLERTFAAPALSHAVWSVLVESLDTGEVVYRLNPDTLVVPASNMKVVSMAAAATRLGWDFRFETRLETRGPVDGATLHGDLVVVGGGDPTINARNGDRDAVFAAWADALRQAGITRIDGRIVGDDNAFDDERYGHGWAWDDFAFGYQAPIGALQFNENVVEVVVRAGASPGERATVELRPSVSDLVPVSRVVTGEAAAEADIAIARFPGRAELEVRGVIPVGGKDVVRTAAVDNPTLYFVRALREALITRGVDVTGPAVDIDDLPDPPTADPLAPDSQPRLLATHHSPPLSEVGKPLMKSSQNLYAETVFRALSLRPGPASVAASQKVVDELMAGWGIGVGQYAVADGSGLSRHNYLSASALVRILRAMGREPANLQALQATLPVAGLDGTLSSRMKATRAVGNAAAKTGTLRSVRSLSGYVTTRDGERLTFAMIANNFQAPTSAVDAVVDSAVDQLAGFSRR